MKRLSFLFLLLGLLLFLGASAYDVRAQDQGGDRPRAEQDDDDDDEYETPEAQKKLAKEAKITKEEARRKALERVPGTVIESEIDKEHGRLVWEFEIKTKNGKIYEVLVDAKTGEIVAVEDESDEEDDDDDPPGDG